VGVAETVNHGITVVITATAVPSSESGVWTQLHHSKRKRSSGECVAVAASSNKWIDII